MPANPAYRWFFDFYTPLRIPFADVDLNVSDPEKLYRKIDDAETEESFVAFLKHEREVFKAFCKVLAGKDDTRCCWGRYSQRRLYKRYLELNGGNRTLNVNIPGPFEPTSTAGLQDYSGETYTFYLEPIEIAFQERDGSTVDRSIPSYKSGGFFNMTHNSGVHISVKAPDAIYQNIVAKQYLYVYENARERTSKVLPARRIDTSIFQVKQPGEYKFFDPSGFYSYLDVESYYLLGTISSFTLKDPDSTYTDVIVRIENNAGFKVIQWKDDKHPKGLDLSGVSFVFHYQYNMTINMAIKEMVVMDHYIDVVLDNVNKIYFTSSSFQPVTSPALLAVEFRVVDNVNEFVWDKLPVAASAYPQYGIKEGEAVHPDRVPSEVSINYRYTALEEGDSFLITQKEDPGVLSVEVGEEKVFTWDYMVYTISGVSNQEAATTYAMLAQTDTGNFGGGEGIQFDKSFLGFVNQLPLDAIYQFDTYQNVYDFMSKVDLENTRFVDLHNVLGDDSILRRFPFNQAKHISWFDIIMLRLLVVPSDRDEAPCCFVVRNNRMEWHDPFQAGLDNEYSDRSLICSHVPKLLGGDVIGDRPLVGVNGNLYGFADSASPDARGAYVRVDPNRTGGIGSGVVTGSRIFQGFQYQWGLRVFYNYVRPYDEVYPGSFVVGNPPIYYSQSAVFAVALENGYGSPAEIFVPADTSALQIHRVPGTGTEGGDKKLEAWNDNSVSPPEYHHLYGPVHPLHFGEYYADSYGPASATYFYRRNTSFCKARSEVLFGMGVWSSSYPVVYYRSLIDSGGCSGQVTMGEYELMLVAPPEEYYRNYQSPRKVVVKMTGGYNHIKCYYRPASTTDPNELLNGHSNHNFTEYRLVELTPFVPVKITASWSRSVWRNCDFYCTNIGDTQEYDKYGSQGISGVRIFDGPEVSMPGSGPSYSFSNKSYPSPSDPWYASFEDTAEYINIFETEPAGFFYQNVGSRLLKNEDVTHFNVPVDGPIFGQFAAHIPYTMKVGSPTPSVILTDSAGTELWDAPTGIASNEGNYWGIFPRNLNTTYEDYVYSIPVAYDGTLLFDVAGNQDIEEISNLQPDLATVGRDNQGLITWKNEVTENKAYWDIIYVRMTFGSVIPIIILVLPEDLLSKGSDWEVQRARTTLRRRSTSSYDIDDLIDDQYSECAHVQDAPTQYYELTTGSSSVTVSNLASSKMPDFEGGDDAWTFSLFTPELDDSFYDEEGFYIIVPNTNRSWKCFASTTDNPWFNDNFDDKVEATYNDKENRWELHIPYPEGTEYYVYFWDVVMSSSLQSSKFTAIGTEGITVQEDEPQDPEYNGQGGVDL